MDQNVHAIPDFKAWKCSVQIDNVKEFDTLLGKHLEPSIKKKTSGALSLSHTHTCVYV